MTGCSPDARDLNPGLGQHIFKNVQLEEVFWVSVYIVHHFLIFNMDPSPSPLLAPLKKYTEINCTIFCQFLSRKNVSDPDPVKRMRILRIRIPEYWSKSKLTTFFASSVKFPPVYSIYFRRRWRTCNRGGWQSGNMCSWWTYIHVTGVVGSQETCVAGEHTYMLQGWLAVRKHV